jgi:hypothetical protein
MHFRPVLDMSWGPALAMWGLMMFPLVVVWTLLSESVALYLLHFQRSFWRCLGNAIVANLASGAVGMIWQFFFFDITAYFFWVNKLIGSPPIDTYQTLDPRTQFFGILILFIIGLIGSILLEGLVLRVLHPLQGDASSASGPGAQHPFEYAFEVSAIINAVSYAGLILVLVLTSHIF